MSRRTVLTAAVAGLVAVWAYAGGIGVIGGGVDFGPEINDRLPWGSTTLAGLALIAVVALPMTAAAFAIWRRLPSARRVALVAGVLLIGWIVVQLAFIRTFSWLQPACVLLGAFVAAWGWAEIPSRTRGVRSEH
ncbi:hypothetical protein [Actinokineospora sp. HUAS TT18]|uniref:hypothetical protein n=1 Tax=Actinokineospora sp. HUAS TT18 TaxID=3447451 RepID=UPI003F520AD9